ncbi:MAG: T9SS type A sorting domain-containing protein, partial [Ignavibacteriaceae bacterium]|nr:T9SS type A sorting domain-containing protein [Ignavibacteriaceae bacterium]
MLILNRKLSPDVVVTSVEDPVYGDVQAAPDEYELAQNFPNPFNPETKIRFSLPESGFVTLKIYDVTGRLISTLLNEQINAGNHEVVFNSSESNLPSGIYIYRLTADKFSASGKMVLLK